MTVKSIFRLWQNWVTFSLTTPLATLFFNWPCMLTPDLPWEGWCSCLRPPTCQGKPQIGVPSHCCYRCQRSPDSSGFSWCEISILCHVSFDGDIFKSIQQGFQGVIFQYCVTLMSSSEASSSFGAFTDDAPSKFFPPIGTFINRFNKTGTTKFGNHSDQPPSHQGLQTLNQTSRILLQNHQSPRLLQISSSVLLPVKRCCSKMEVLPSTFRYFQVFSRYF